MGCCDLRASLDLLDKRCDTYPVLLSRSHNGNDAMTKGQEPAPHTTYFPSEADLADLANRFTYHAPKAGQPERYTAIRSSGGVLARIILEETPKSREQALALTNLEQAIFWANAAIARHE
jgi:hypothetical protein